MILLLLSVLSVCNAFTIKPISIFIKFNIYETLLYEDKTNKRIQMK